MLKVCARVFLILLSICVPRLADAAAPGVVNWGAYIVRTHKDRGGRATVDISRNGRAVRSVAGVGTPRIEVMTFRRHPLLFVSVGENGNSGLDLVYAFQYTPNGIRNVLAMQGVLSKIRVARERQGDLLVVQDYAVFNEFDHFSRGSIGPVERIYAWKSHHFVNVTHQYQHVALARAESAKQQIMSHRHAIEHYLRSRYVDGHADSMAQSHEDIMAPVIEYWANEAAAGRGKSAERFLRIHASPILRRWIKKHRSMLYDSLKVRSHVMPVDNRLVLGY